MDTIRDHIRLSIAIVATTICQIFVLALMMTASHDTVIRILTDVGIVGIFFAFVYKETIWIIQMMTSRRNDFDRMWLWQTQATALLFLFALWLNIIDEKFLFRHDIVVTVIWFEIWAQVMVSAMFVLYYAFTLRVIPAIRNCRENDKLCTFATLRRHLSGE